MRDSLRDAGRLQDMIEMALLLQEEKSKHNLAKIKNDKILFFGLTKMIEIIGEAAYMLTNDFKDANPEIPWREIIGMRHILVHGYSTINPEALWGVIENDIPALIPALKACLEKFEK